jgi:hypothetical protein
MLKQRSWRTLRRLADAAGIGAEDLRAALEDVIEVPVEQEPGTVRKTGAVWKRGESGAAGCFVYDPNGTDPVPAGTEAPPGYFGP